MLKIDTTNSIKINGRDTGLKLTQTVVGTVIYTPETAGGQKYREHKMPHARYSAAHDYPASGVAGRGQLEQDIIALMGKLANG
jgi:hypothetical protein